MRLKGGRRGYATFAIWGRFVSRHHPGPITALLSIL